MTKRRQIAGNGDNKQRKEYAEICKTIKKKEIQPWYNTRNDHGTIESEESMKNAAARPRQTNHTPGQAAWRNSYTELYDSEQNTIIHSDPTKVPKITSWDVEAALPYIKNGTVTGNDHLNIETLKAGKYTISKTLTKLCTKCLSERCIPTALTNAKVMVIINKGNKKDLKN